MTVPDPFLRRMPRDSASAATVPPAPGPFAPAPAARLAAALAAAVRLWREEA
jgi:hypothetical protein